MAKVSPCWVDAGGNLLGSGSAAMAEAAAKVNTVANEMYFIVFQSVRMVGKTTGNEVWLQAFP